MGFMDLTLALDTGDHNGRSTSMLMCRPRVLVIVVPRLCCRLFVFFFFWKNTIDPMFKRNIAVQSVCKFIQESSESQGVNDQLCQFSVLAILLKGGIGMIGLIGS